MASVTASARGRSSMMKRTAAIMTATVAASTLRPWRRLTISSGGRAQAQGEPEGQGRRRADALDQDVEEAGRDAGRQPGQEAERERVPEREHMDDRRHQHPVGEREGVRRERVLRHPLVDEVVAARGRLVAHQRVEDHDRHEGQRADRHGSVRAGDPEGRRHAVAQLSGVPVRDEGRRRGSYHRAGVLPRDSDRARWRARRARAARRSPPGQLAAAGALRGRRGDRATSSTWRPSRCA